MPISLIYFWSCVFVFKDAWQAYMACSYVPQASMECVSWYQNIVTAGLCCKFFDVLSFYNRNWIFRLKGTVMFYTHPRCFFLFPMLNWVGDVFHYNFEAYIPDIFLCILCWFFFRTSTNAVNMILFRLCYCWHLTA